MSKVEELLSLIFELSESKQSEGFPIVQVAELDSGSIRFLSSSARLSAPGKVTTVDTSELEPYVDKLYYVTAIKSDISKSELAKKILEEAKYFFIPGSKEGKGQVFCFGEMEDVKYKKINTNLGIIIEKFQKEKDGLKLSFSLLKTKATIYRIDDIYNHLAFWANLRDVFKLCRISNWKELYDQKVAEFQKEIKKSQKKTKKKKKGGKVLCYKLIQIKGFSDLKKVDYDWMEDEGVDWTDLIDCWVEAPNEMRTIDTRKAKAVKVTYAYYDNRADAIGKVEVTAYKKGSSYYIPVETVDNITG